MTLEFDPPALAEEIAREGFRMPGEDELADFGPNGIVQAAITTISAIVSAWLVGEGESFRGDLARAAGWADEADSQGLAYGGDNLLFTVELRRARAVAHWLLEGKQPRALWRSCAQASEQLWRRERETRPLLSPLYDVLVDRLLAGEEALAVDGLDSVPETERDPLTRALAAVLAAADARSRAAAMGALLATHAPRLIGYLPHPNMAAWLALAFAETGLSDDPATTLAMIYAIVPDLALPPALRKRGWSDEGEAKVRLKRDTDFDRLDRLLLTLGLTRDPDAVAQPPSPEFASWTMQPGLDLEADWHAPDGTSPWLEMRGRAAGRAAAALAEALGGELAPGPDAALAEILTVPPAARSGGNAKVRWEMLAAVLRAAPEVERRAAEPLVEAGLRDPDWRVRMTAVWGVGALRIGRLADAAVSAPLPASGYEGLSGEDRRTLLALRDAARDRAAGRTPAPPDREGGGPGGAGRAAFVGQIAALFDRLAPPPGDRHEALVMALLRMPAPARDRTPRAWRSWMA